MSAGRRLSQVAELRSDLQDLAAEDAVDSTLVAAAAANWDAAGHEVLSYEGPFGVGYGVAILYQAPLQSAPAGAHGAVVYENETACSGNPLPQIAWRSIAAAFGGTEETGICRRRAFSANGMAFL